MTEPNALADMTARYGRRRTRLVRLLRPPLPLVVNPAERFLPDTTTPRLFIGGAGGVIPPGFLCVDLVPWPGVHLVADAHALPFADGTVGAIECDAVLEHVTQPEQMLAEFDRVLKPGGFVHVVIPFCHPYHAYPEDYRRWTLDGLRLLCSRFDIVSSGVRTGPTAALLIFLLEYVRLLAPRPLRGATYVALGWVVWPLRYLDRWLLKRSDAHTLANSLFLLARKRDLASPERAA